MLYWKRTQYFWAIIAVIFAGYGAILTAKDQNNDTRFVQYVLICLGIVFSLGWYLVNRGSKFWQLNWEQHVDSLENDVIGPLFKTTISKKDFSLNRKALYSFWNPAGPYQFSVSKINQLISLFVFFIWVILLLRHVFLYAHLLEWDLPIDWGMLGVSVSMIVAVVSFLWAGRGGRKETWVRFARSRPEYWPGSSKQD